MGRELDAVLLEAKGGEHGFGEVEASLDLADDLAGSAEDVSVVLGEAADAEQTVHRAGALVAIDVAELGVALREVAVGLRRILVDENVAGAIHGLEAIFRVVEFHGRVHVFGVDILVAGDLPERAAHDVRRENHVIATANTLFAHPVLHGLADEAAFGVPEDEACACDLLDGEEVELLAEDAVVAGLDLFEVLEVGVEVFGVEERGAIETLELLVLFVSEPVGAGERGELECLDARGRWDVGAAAEVSEGAVFVERDGFAFFGEALDEVDLHELAVCGVVGEGLVAGFFDALELFVAGDDFGHAGFDGGEVGLGEGDFAVDVVEEAVVGGGAVAELGFGEELEDRCRHDMRGGVADHAESGGVVLLEELEGDVFGERRSEVDDALGLRGVAGVHRLFGGFERGFGGGRGCGLKRLDARDDDYGGEARGDAVGDVERGCAAGDFADGTVGKLDLYLVAHLIRIDGLRAGRYMRSLEPNVLALRSHRDSSIR